MADVELYDKRRKVRIEKYKNTFPENPFYGGEVTPERVYRFLEGRCMDRNRLCLSEYLECPVFGNGASFLSNYGMFPPDEEIKKQTRHAAAKSFSGSFEQQAIVLGTKIKLDYKAVLGEIEKIKHVRLRAVAGYQLKRYRTFFKDIKE